MTPEPRDTDWAVLGLTAGAGIDDVHRAYHRRRSLYRKDSLATYSLLEDDERQTTIDRIEAAYRRLLDHHPCSTTTRQPDPVEIPPEPVGPPPSLTDSPGEHLRHHRQARGLTLERIADETKIRKALLEAIEAEDFDLLPAQVYVRGFVVQVARLLLLEDPEAVARAFLDRMEQ